MTSVQPDVINEKEFAQTPQTLVTRAASSSLKAAIIDPRCHEFF